MTSPEKNSKSTAPRFAVVVACNDDEVLQSNLMRSPEISSFEEVVVRRGFKSAGEAYNSGMDATTADVIVFAHQDVYLPDGWFKTLSDTIEKLSARDPQWAVLGLFGIALAGNEAGHVYSCGIQRVLGRPMLEAPVEVGSLDELVLIVRRSSGVRFDDKLPGFHLYGTDICLEARRKGMKSYAISTRSAFYNSNGLEQTAIRVLRRAVFPAGQMAGPTANQNAMHADYPVGLAHFAAPCGKFFCAQPEIRNALR